MSTSYYGDADDRAAYYDTVDTYDPADDLPDQAAVCAECGAELADHHMDDPTVVPDTDSVCPNLGGTFTPVAGQDGDTSLPKGWAA